MCQISATSHLLSAWVGGGRSAGDVARQAVLAVRVAAREEAWLPEQLQADAARQLLLQVVGARHGHTPGLQ